MRILCSIFVLLVVAAFGASSVSPAEDLPETPYDESEALPCLKTLAFSLNLSRISIAAVTITEPCPSNPSAMAQAQIGRKARPLHRTRVELALRCTFLC